MASRSTTEHTVCEDLVFVHTLGDTQGSVVGRLSASLYLELYNGKKVNIAVLTLCKYPGFIWPNLVTSDRMTCGVIPNAPQRYTTLYIENCPFINSTFQLPSAPEALLFLCVVLCWLKITFTEDTAIPQIGWVGRDSYAHTMWPVKVVCLVAAMALFTGSGSVNGEEATHPGLQSAFTSKGLAYSESMGSHHVNSLHWYSSVLVTTLRTCCTKCTVCVGVWGFTYLLISPFLLNGCLLTNSCWNWAANFGAETPEYKDSRRQRRRMSCLQVSSCVTLGWLGWNGWNTRLKWVALL